VRAPRSARAAARAPPAARPRGRARRGPGRARAARRQAAAVPRRVGEPLEEDRREARDGDPARSAEAAELRAELCAHLAELPPAQAKIVVLKDAFDFGFEEIAAAEAMPVGTAKCYAHRGRHRLQEKLSA
jgi:DNA-directed RNA polymerase specialized sigma24 family protein